MYELKQERWGLLVSLLFYSYLIVIIIVATGDARPFDGNSTWIGNFLYLSLLPMFGFAMSRTMMRVMSDDSYTHKVAYWRSLPISSHIIASSRIVQFLIVFTVGWLYLFTVSFLFVGWIHQLGLWTAIGNALTWYGYGVGVGTSFLIFELGVSGKQYMGVSMLYMIGILGLAIGLHYAQFSLLEEIAGAIAQGVWWLPLVALLAGAGIVAANYMLIRRRIEHRNIY
ncbi:hypothetical protein PA598K_05470 [Paenibacillus sp. 598K]|nr:hypothetical protein PA598K_05470 [Paenibacillus sp. 598K]